MECIKSQQLAALEELLRTAAVQKEWSAQGAGSARSTLMRPSHGLVDANDGDVNEPRLVIFKRLFISRGEPVVSG